MNGSSIQLYAIPGIPLISPGDDLAGLLCTALEESGIRPANGDILIVAQKLVSKAESRQRKLSEVQAGSEAVELAAATEKEPEIVQLILDESRSILRHRPGVIIAEHRLGMVLANAGIDRSNVTEDRDVVLLFPEDPDASAAALKQQLDNHFNVTIGLVIADSVGRAWRMGTTGMAIGCAGIDALVNLRGRHDMFGRELEVSEHAVADSVASAAELLMGEADEATPVVLLRGMNEGSSSQDSGVLLRPAAEDMFR